MSELAIIGRERSLIDSLARTLNRACKGNEVTALHAEKRGTSFDVRIFDGKDFSGRVARVTVELLRVEP